MAQSTLERVRHDIYRLEPEELRSVEHAVQERLEATDYSPEERRAMQSLVDAGLLREIKPRCRTPKTTFMPVPIQGKPLSETIIEDRR